MRLIAYRCNNKCGRQAIPLSGLPPGWHTRVVGDEVWDLCPKCVEQYVGLAVPFTAAQVIRGVAQSQSVPIAQLTGDSRRKVYVEPRHIAMYIIRLRTELSLPQIGSRFGGRDHTSVLHGIKKVEARMASDHSFRIRVQEIIYEIEQSAVAAQPVRARIVIDGA